MTGVESLAGSDPAAGFYLLWIGIVVIGICAAILWFGERQDQRREQQHDWTGENGMEPQR